MEERTSALKSTREIPATAEEIFAAISTPERLARWWGPAGFTNTISVCEFKEGGRWSLTMHGPDGKNYANECVFAEIDAPRRVVVEHTSAPKYRLTITLTGTATGTLAGWKQEF